MLIEDEIGSPILTYITGLIEFVGRIFIGFVDARYYAEAEDVEMDEF